MSTFGSQPSSWNFWQENESTENQVATLATCPANGLLQSITCFVAGNTSTGSPWPIIFALWDGGTGALLAQSATYNGLGAGSGASGGQSWVTLGMPATVLASGHSYYIGFWHNTTTAIEWSSNTSSGTFYWKTAASLGSFSGPSSTAASIGAYATFSTGVTYVRRSGAWVPATVKARRSGAWVVVNSGTGVALVRRSGTWVP